jgi:putative acyl-CoA dehydrogenase
MICLNVLRAMAKEPETLGAFLAEVDQAAGLDDRLDRDIAAIKVEFENSNDVQVCARHLVKMMVLGLQESLMVRNIDLVFTRP